MAGQIAGGEIGDTRRARRPAAARLDPGDRRLRPDARPPRVDLAVDAERQAPGRAAGAGLRHIDLAPRGVDPDPEPGEFAVPDDEIPLARAKHLDDVGGKERSLAIRHDYYYILAYT